MDKKIGILTFCNSINYGAVLQTYALQTFLSSENDGNVEVVNYCNIYNQRELNPIYLKSSNIIKDILLKSYNLLFFIPLKSRINSFLKFKKDFINLSQKTYSSSEELIHCIDKYDIYVSGSDQVFHPRIKDWKAFYLGFKKGSAKKIAYAPSFGVSDLTAEEKKRITPYLKDFDVLSCREAEGTKILSEILNRKIPQVCDPVFLLSANEWSKIAVKPEIRSPYILVYDLNGGRKLLPIVNKLRAQTGLQVVWLTGNVLNRFKGCKIINNAGPREFVGYISNAKYVITDSFHGTAFSLIFEKNVIPYIAMQTTSSRIYSIMSKCNLSHRIVVGERMDLEFSELSKEYKILLSDFIDSSKNYLKRAINI